MTMKQKKSGTAIALILFASVAMILLIPGAGAALPLAGNGGLSLSNPGFGSVYGSTLSIPGYSLPKSPLLSQAYSATIPNSGTEFANPEFLGQISTNMASSSSGSSSQLAGLFSSALSSYYKNPPKPITDASPSEFLVASPGSDGSWNTFFNPPVYHGCGCG